MTDNQNDKAIIILAAGASTRLGQPKQLVKFKEKKLLEHITELALKFNGQPVIVVLGAYFEKIKKSIEHLPIHIVENKKWESGMGSTISTGINYLENNFPKLIGTYILLTDQPFVNADLLKKIKAEIKIKNADIIASKYAETFGPPAYFSKNIFPELKKLNGQKGAKGIFSKYKDELTFVNFPAGKYDVDTPDDLAKIQAQKKLL